jgi:glycosyltransferase involved in cell wall biosynthesis/mannose-6-phosphate isomerase-like protein (cupin superfamily)
MRIAVVAPISWRVPPRHYGPWERVVSLLTEGLVSRGLDVTLFATADSLTRARLASVCPRPYSEDPSIDPKVWECLHISEAFERAGEFDLIHNHFDFLPLSYCRLVRTPVLTTIHGFSSERIVPVYEKYNADSYYVSISNADRHPRLSYLATIYHGIPPEEFTLRREPGRYLLFFGRIHPDKGVAEAIEVARIARRPLVIAGIIQDRDYFHREVEPHLDGERVRYIGPVGPDKRDQVIGNCQALLHMINFNEPFGLSMIEAMACGRPVIARRRGSVPEIIEHGQTGFIVETVDEAAEAINHLRELEPERMRRQVEQRFSRQRMVDDYIRVYREVLGMTQEGLPSAFSKHDQRHDKRPWGSFTVLDEAPGYKVKRIEVLPGKRLSYQRHSKRAEHWMVVHGTGKVTLDQRQIAVRPGETLDVPVGAAHRIENTGHQPLIFIEIQRGDYLGEDDIIRIEDDFGRAQSA